MCLLIALSRMVDGAPLVVAANRDEYLRRPAVSSTVLREAGPRILGGRDLAAGGTWLAVNDTGVLAGLTNQPSGQLRDPSKRSRGELPLMFAAYQDAATAVAEVTARLDPRRYNPCCLLVGDRTALFSVGLAGGDSPVVRELRPGRYVLENVPLDAASAKADQIATEVDAGLGAGTGVVDALAEVLRSHQPPACVHHTEHDYGTRSAMIVTVQPAGPPEVLVADGAPCQAPFLDVTGLWTADSLSPAASP
jgi:uncharacterized protein with NRDE domain